jgi:hypothetical protein
VSLTLNKSQVLNNMAGVLYDFLPGSGNANFSFPIAARQAGVAEFWEPGSKRPAILKLIQNTFERRHGRFCPLIMQVVRLGLAYRSGKAAPLTIQEIDRLNALLLKLSLKIPDLHDANFRQGLASLPEEKQEAKPTIDTKRHEALSGMLNELISIDAQRRGFAFEHFLDEMFSVFNLAPRKSFRLVGEQIDGSFHLTGETYLVEAKWQAPQVGNRELQAFAGTIRTKATWSRGLYISYSGFSDDGLTAFSRGDATRFICLDGLELWQVINHKLDFGEVLSLKTRRAAETGRAHIPIRELFHTVG